MCYQVLRKLAPKTSTPIVTAKNPDTHIACWSAEEELKVRARALADIFNGDLIPMNEAGGPQSASAETDLECIPPITMSGVRGAFAQLPNHKTGPVLEEP